MYEVTRFVNQGAREIDPKQEIAQSRDFLAKSVWRRNIKSRNLPKNGWRRASLQIMDGGVHACTSRLLDLDPHYQQHLLDVLGSRNAPASIEFLCARTLTHPPGRPN